MRIFVVGMPGAGNLGDDLISVMLVQHIFGRWPQAEVGVLCAGYPIPLVYPNPTQIDLLPAPRRRSWSEYVGRIRAINDFVERSDLILIGGGGLFQDSHYRFTVHKWLRYALHASPQQVPVAAVGVGFGPFNHAFSRWYLTKALGRLSAIQVRDEESSDIVKSLGYPSLIAPDIVAGTSLAQTPFVRALERTQTPALGCSIRPWPGLKFEALVNLISATVRANGLSCRLFVSEHAEPHNTSEYVYALKIAEALTQSKIAVDVVCYRKQSMDEFAEAFSSVAMAIATRLHANILWQKLGIPVLPVSYAPKVAGLYEERGGRVISVEAINDTYAPDMFQKIELAEPYSLPSDSELLGSARYSPWGLHALAQAVGIMETGYGLGRSVAWRLKRLGKLSSF